MRRVNLDEEYKLFIQKFFELHGGEIEWRRYQESEGLMNDS